MWNQPESLNTVWNYSRIIVLFHCFDFALLLFLSVVSFLLILLTSFLVINKILDQFFHNNAIMQDC
jgi:predicted neutral ceramidase superfamily lipid hydrolase